MTPDSTFAGCFLMMVSGICAFVANRLWFSGGITTASFASWFRSYSSCFVVGVLTLAVLAAVGKLVLVATLGRLTSHESKSLRDAAFRFMAFHVLLMVAFTPPDPIEMSCWTVNFLVIGFFKALVAPCRERANVMPETPESRDVWRILICAATVFDLSSWWAVYFIYRLHEVGFWILFLLFFQCFVVCCEALKVVIKLGLPLFFGRRDTDELHTVAFAINTTIYVSSILYYINIWAMRGISLGAIDVALFLLLRYYAVKLKNAITTFRSYRRALRELRVNFADVSAEELRALDDTCAICRDKMETAKRLPCGHMFHFACIMQWIKYRRICPNCRQPLLINTPQGPQAPPPENAQPAPQPGPAQVIAQARFLISEIRRRQQDELQRMQQQQQQQPQPPQPLGQQQQPAPQSQQQQAWQSQQELRHRIRDVLAGIQIPELQPPQPQAQQQQQQGANMPPPNPAGNPQPPAPGPQNGGVSNSWVSGLRWLPSVSFNVARVPVFGGPVPDQQRLAPMVAQVREMFPHVPEQAVTRDLMRTGSLDQTIENILTGHIDMTAS